MAEEDYYINDLANAGVPDPTRLMLPQKDDSIEPTMVLPRRDNISVETEGAPQAMPVPYDVFENDPQSMAAFEGSNIMADASTASPVSVETEEPLVAPQEPVLIDTVPDEPVPEQEAPELAGPPVEAMQEQRRGQDLDKVYQIAIDPKPFQQEHGISERRAKGAVNTAFLKTLIGSNISGDPTDMGRQAAIRLVGQKLFPEQGVKDEDSLFQAIQGQAVKRKDEGELLEAMQAYARRSGVVGEYRSQEVETAFDALKQMSGYDPAKTADYMKAIRIWEQQAADSVRQWKPSIKAIMDEFDAGGSIEEIPSAEITSWSEDDWQGILNAVHVMSQGMSEEERDNWLWGMGKSLHRVSKNIVYGSVRFGVGAAMKGEAMAKLVTKDLTGIGKDREDIVADEVKTVENFELYRDRLGDLQKIFKGEFDPIEKTGKWYVDWPQEIPAFASNIALMAANPFVLIGSVAEGTRDSLYQNARAQGFSEEQARGYRDAIGPAVYVPVILIEKLQVDTATGKIPGYNNFMVRVSNRFQNRYLRAGARAVTTTAVEAGQEVTQDMTDTTVREMASWLGEEMASVEWTEEMAANMLSYPEYFVSMLGVGALGAVGGRHLDQAAEALKQDIKTDPKTRIQMIMGGASTADIEALEKAEGMGDTNAAYQKMMGNLDPQSEEAKEMLEQVKKAQKFSERMAQVEAEVRDGRMPTFRLTDNGYTVIDNSTGKTIAEGLTSEQAIEVAKESFLAIEAFDKTMTAELAGTLMAQEAAMQEGGEAEITLEQKYALEHAKEQGPAAEKRFWMQVERMEEQEYQLRKAKDPNAERLSRETIETRAALLPVFGFNYMEDKGAGKGKQVVTKIFGGGRGLMTVFHEEAHGYLRTAIDNGSMSWQGVYDFFTSLDKSLKNKFLGDSFGEVIGGKFTAEQKAALDEAVAELMEVEILRTRKRGGMKGNLESDKIRQGLMANMQMTTRRVGQGEGEVSEKARAAKGLGKILFAARHFWKQIFNRLTQIRAGIASGEIDESQIDEFTNKLFGLDAQVEFDKKVEQEAASIGLVPGSEIEAKAKPYRDRTGDEQGEPLTTEEIQEGIEDEPGTLAEPEIDDDIFSDDSTEGPSYSIAGKIPLIKRIDLKGKKKFVYFSDRTRVGSYKGIDPKSGINIDLQGGPAYPYMMGHGEANAGWAFTTKGMFTRFQKRVDSTDGIGLTTLYSKENLRANPTFLKAYVAEVRHAIKTKKITTARFLEVANGLREAAVNAKKAGKPVIPLESTAGKLFAKEWKSLKTFEKALAESTFDVRSGMFFAWNNDKKPNKKTGEVNNGSKIGVDSLVKEGFPNLTKMVDLFADPSFDGMPAGTIVGAVEFEKGQTEASTAEDIGAESHESYGVVTKGKGLGYFENPIMVTDVIKKPNKTERQITRSAETSMAGVSFSVGPAGGTKARHYYSKMDQVIGQKLQGKTATPEQIMAVIDPKKGSGVKAEEIKWSGIEQKVQDMAEDGKVNIEELRKWITTEGMVKMEERASAKQVKTEYNSERGGWIIVDEYGDPIENSSGEVDVFSSELEAVSDQGFEPKYSEYTLPGGENYREVVLTMPERDPIKTGEKIRIARYGPAGLENELIGAYSQSGEVLGVGTSEEEAREQAMRNPVIQKESVISQNYRSTHFDDIENYVAHMRLNERDGGLFIEEIQSDRHQAGRKKGYKEEVGIVSAIDNLTLEQAKEIIRNNEGGNDTLEGDETVEELRDTVRYYLKEEGQDESGELFSYLKGIANIDGIPDAPYRKDWHLAMFKRALGHAVDRGMSWIGWTSGETQAERYDLSRHVDSIDWKQSRDGKTYAIVATKDGREFGRKEGMTAYQLEEHVGKDVAQKIVEGQGRKLKVEGETIGTLGGVDLKIGGEGMKAFYDKMLPTAVQKYVKQWGAKVEQSSLNPPRDKNTELRIDTNDVNGKLYVFEGNGGDVAGPFENREAAQEWIDNKTQSQFWDIEEERGMDGEPFFVAFDTRQEDDSTNREFETEEEAQAYIDSLDESAPIWKVEITPEMRENIEQVGQPAFSIGPVTPQMDADYLAAVEAGDTAKAQEMVDQAAGDAPKVWRGDSESFNQFDFEMRGKSTGAMRSGRDAFFFTTSKKDSASFAALAASRLRTESPTTRQFFLMGKIKEVEGENPSVANIKALKSKGVDGLVFRGVVDTAGDSGDLMVDGERVYVDPRGGYEEIFDDLQNPKTREVTIANLEEYMDELLYPEDGESDSDRAWKKIISAIKDDPSRVEIYTPEAADVYAMFNPEQIKSADPITRDDAGNVIPLSERFNEQSLDIRYSIANMAATYVPETEQEVKAANKAESNKQKARSPILAVAAVRLANGEITVEDYANAIDVIDPFVAKGVEKPPSESSIRKYISTAKVDKVGVKVDPETLVEVRIDIPTYTKSVKDGNAVYAVTLHEPVSSTATRVGTPLSYVPMAHLTNVDMRTRAISGKGGAIRIAVGQHKTPLATVAGKLVSTSAIPKDISEYTEVSYNPIRSSEFRDVSNRRVVIGGDEAVSIGSRVYVKNPEYGQEPTGFIDSLTPEADIRYSLGPAEMASGLADSARRRMMKAPEYKVAFFQNLLNRLGAIQAFIDNRGTAYNFDAFGKEFTDKFSNEKEGILNALAILEAIQKSLPVELRGKLGGALTLAKQNDPEKQLEFLKGKLKRAGEVIDNWARDQARDQIESLFKMVKVKKTAKGIPKSILTADFIDRLNKIQEMSEMSQEQVDDQVNALLKEIEAQKAIGEATDEDIDAMNQEIAELMAFGNMKGMDAPRAISMLENLTSLIYAGKTVKEAKDAKFKAEIQMLKDVVNKEVTGGKGRMSDQEAKRKADRSKWLNRLNKFHLQNISFEWLLNALVRADQATGTLKSNTHRMLATMVHKATHNEKRANMASLEKYTAFMSKVFGGKRGLALSNMISSLVEEKDSTGVYLTEYGKGGAFTKKRIKAVRVLEIMGNKKSRDALGISEEEYDKIVEAYEARVAASPNGELRADAVIEYKKPNVGKRVEMRLSQDQALNLTMLWRQPDLRTSMEREGFDESTMKQMEAFLTKEAKQIREWLTKEYNDNYTYLNAVFKEEMGVNLPKHEFYSPAVRKAQGVIQEMAVDSAGNQAMSTTPGFLISRVTNFAQVDQTVGALSLYMRHTAQSHHYVSWAKAVKRMRYLLGDPEVKKNIQDYAGKDIYGILMERINWFADGGNRNAQHIEFLDKMRSGFTMSKLGFDLGIMIKQFTSLPAYAWDMGIKNFAKYSAKFMANPIGNMKFIWNLPYTQARFKEGYERDVIAGLKEEGGIVTKMLQFGMLTGKSGDIVPVMAGGWMAYQNAYDQHLKENPSDKAGAARAAELTFEMSTDRAQQAGDTKDLSSFQGGGSIARLFTMFKTSPRQYYANVYESLLDAMAGKQGAKTEFARRLFIGQIVLPVVFQFISDLLRSPFNDDDDEDYSPEAYLRAMLLGPLNGLFIIGDGLTMVASGLAGDKVWPVKNPVLSGFEKLAWAGNDIREGEWLEAADTILRGLGESWPSPLTFYDIFRKQYDKFTEE